MLKLTVPILLYGKQIGTATNSLVPNNTAIMN